MTHCWYWNGIENVRGRGFWCLACKLVKIERPDGRVDYYHHLAIANGDVDDCTRWVK